MSSLSQRCTRQLLREPFQRGSLPLFLTPAFSSPRAQCFSTTVPAQSRVGGAAISVPPEVSLNLVDIPKSTVRVRGKDTPKFAAHIKGPKGEMILDIPSFLNVNQDATSQKTTLSVVDPEQPHQRAMWGTTRALLQNHITGVSEGHICVLSLVGVGYRATIESKATTVNPSFPGQQFVSLKVGFSHPIELPIPQGIQASTPQPTRILLESVDKRLVTQFAAEIREWRRPEPYKGKGIFVNGETIKLKAKKIK
ncbi:Ribosomal protein L6 bacterial-type [Penicillium macrosclerotiorum]|uniref:Ribosomal protein L6 bacterial-type n=1 Tax=Penicillium macrosclerotiorum TaxID=303699 RepID=UPI002547B469|nr:Ribosomal protein L6 bacterial-type [Penicillium macrosclerotiorum]KAJ5669816.1 Ribosomal protein L6 bacterial-type [Penicillium macrosclerotiorum]